MKPNRRSFLLTGGAAALAATLGAKAMTSRPQQASAKAARPVNAGYELTAHVRKYYHTASI